MRAIRIAIESGLRPRDSPHPCARGLPCPEISHQRSLDSGLVSPRGHHPADDPQGGSEIRCRGASRQRGACNRAKVGERRMRMHADAGESPCLGNARANLVADRQGDQHLAERQVELLGLGEQRREHVEPAVAGCAPKSLVELAPAARSAVGDCRGVAVGTRRARCEEHRLREHRL